MRHGTPPACTVLVLLLLALLLQPQALSAQSELELGVAAFNDSRYQVAIEHLRRAVAVDPSARLGHLYLARACENAYIESESFPENDQANSCAISEYAWILERKPLDTETMNAIGHRHYVTRRFDDAERFYRKVLETNPLDSEALYTLAVIQWTRSYQMAGKAY